MAKTEPTTTELVEDTSRRSPGRRYRTGADREAILERFDRSGLTQRAFARSEGVNYATLVSWLGKRRVSSSSTEPPVRFEEVHLPAAMALEVRLPCGTVVRGTQADALALLVRLIRG
jgi:hypothetical protein